MADEELDSWDDWRDSLSAEAELRHREIRASRPNLEAPRWCVVVVDEVAVEPLQRNFGSLAELRQFLMDLPGDTWAMAFYGWPMLYTEATPGSSLKYLVRPDGVLTPLFDVPDGAVIASHYYRGEGPLRLSVASEVPAVTSYETYGEEND